MNISPRLTKNFIRIWIGITALLGFIGGWGFLAHAGKPASTSPAQSNQPSATMPTPLPTLAPLNFQNQSSSSGLQQLPSISQSPSFNLMPQLRTGGS